MTMEAAAAAGSDDETLEASAAVPESPAQAARNRWTVPSVPDVTVWLARSLRAVGGRESEAIAAVEAVLAADATHVDALVM